MDQERSSRAVQAMPTLALRGLVAFPGVTCILTLRRSKSILAIKAAMDLNREIFIITQENIEAEIRMSRISIKSALSARLNNC